MEGKFPTINVFKAALAAPLSKPLEILKALLIFIGAIIVSGLLFAVVGAGFGLEAMNALQQQLAAGQIPAGTGTLFIVFLLCMVVFGLAAAYIFNYWVRFGAFGHANARFDSFGDALSASFVNMIKFVFIIIIIGLVNLLVMFVMASIGLGPDLTAEPTGDVMQAALDTSISSFGTSVVTTVIACFVYSLFSANLTQTALRSDEEGMEHPHTIDFAIVLILLYAVVLIPGILAAFTGSIVLYFIVQFVLGLYISLCIPVAHGIRYRVCVPEPEQEENFEL